MPHGKKTNTKQKKRQMRRLINETDKKKERAVFKTIPWIPFRVNWVWVHDVASTSIEHKAFCFVSFKFYAWPWLFAMIHLVYQCLCMYQYMSIYIYSYPVIHTNRLLHYVKFATMFANNVIPVDSFVRHFHWKLLKDTVLHNEGNPIDTFSLSSLDLLHPWHSQVQKETASIVYVDGKVFLCGTYFL